MMKISKLEIVLHSYVVSCALLAFLMFPFLEKEDPIAWVCILYSLPFAFLGRLLTGFLGFQSVELQSLVAGIMIAAIMRAGFYGKRRLQGHHR